MVSVSQIEYVALKVFDYFLITELAIYRRAVIVFAVSEFNVCCFESWCCHGDYVFWFYLLYEYQVIRLRFLIKNIANIRL